MTYPDNLKAKDFLCCAIPPQFWLAAPLVALADRSGGHCGIGFHRNQRLLHADPPFCRHFYAHVQAGWIAFLAETLRLAWRLAKSSLPGITPPLSRRMRGAF